jgi:hypothetical protein
VARLSQLQGERGELISLQSGLATGQDDRIGATRNDVPKDLKSRDNGKFVTEVEPLGVPRVCGVTPFAP